MKLSSKIVVGQRYGNKKAGFNMEVDAVICKTFYRMRHAGKPAWGIQPFAVCFSRC